MTFKVEIKPSFEKEIYKMPKDHQRRVLKFIDKLEMMGRNALNRVLDVKGKYLLAEMKSNKPPYRLYVYFDQEINVFYIVAWEHKKQQEKIINELRSKMKDTIKFGLKSIF